MKEYHKIQTVYKRDPETKNKFLLEGEFSTPELEYLQHTEWAFTEKVDGTNIRVMFDGGAVTFGGKTDKAVIQPFLLDKLQARFLPLTDAFKELFKENADVCLYGEGYGAKIQKIGPRYRPDQDFVLFDVRINEWRLQRSDVEEVGKRLGLDVVPIIGTGTLHDMVELARNGFNSRWGDFTAEGIVARPAVELKTRGGQRIITKIKYKDFKRP